MQEEYVRCRDKHNLWDACVNAPGRPGMDCLFNNQAAQCHVLHITCYVKLMDHTATLLIYVFRYATWVPSYNEDGARRSREAAPKALPHFADNKVKASDDSFEEKGKDEYGDELHTWLAVVAMKLIMMTIWM